MRKTQEYQAFLRTTQREKAGMQDESELKKLREELDLEDDDEGVFSL